jgi:type II secretory pathway component GspD/PulD (secretin)
LATKGKLEVLSRPSIMARNNQEAVIVVGQEVPFVTNSRVTDNGQTINTIQYDNVGIILRVTPFITSKNTVEMIVAPEISNLTNQTVQISDTVSSPVISKRSAETVVVTPNGATAVIGGLMETQKLEAIRKIPLLGDIPYLGAAFRRVVKNDVKRELLIFLTPFIVNDPETVQRMTHSEVENTELVQRAFSEKDFEKFFDQQDTGKRYREAMVDGGAIPLDGARPVADVVAPATHASPAVSQKTTTTQTTTKKPAPKAATKPKTKAPATKQD